MVQRQPIPRRETRVWGVNQKSVKTSIHDILRNPKYSGLRLIDLVMEMNQANTQKAQMESKRIAETLVEIQKK